MRGSRARVYVGIFHFRDETENAGKQLISEFHPRAREIVVDSEFEKSYKKGSNFSVRNITTPVVVKQAAIVSCLHFGFTPRFELVEHVVVLCGGGSRTKGNSFNFVNSFSYLSYCRFNSVSGM